MVGGIILNIVSQTIKTIGKVQTFVISEFQIYTLLVTICGPILTFEHNHECLGTMLQFKLKETVSMILQGILPVTGIL